jgi:hypothetical protein
MVPGPIIGESSYLQCPGAHGRAASSGDFMASTRKYQRTSLPTAVSIPVTVIQFGKLERIDLTVKGVDISDGGLGIVSDVPLSPGFIWFWSAVGDYKGGMIVWSRKADGYYQAGIQFLPIPHSPRDYLRSSED